MSVAGVADLSRSLGLLQVPWLRAAKDVRKPLTIAQIGTLITSYPSLSSR